MGTFYSREFEYGRFAQPGRENYEVSSKGDARFSALWATLADGRTIEQAYQLDVKGYREDGNDWRIGKGRPAKDGRPIEELYEAYKDLWRQWISENPDLFAELRVLAAGKVLTDRFASSPVSQARALAELLNEQGE